jgi:hypothetical protein
MLGDENVADISNGYLSSPKVLFFVIPLFYYTKKSTNFRHVLPRVLGKGKYHPALFQ